MNNPIRLVVLTTLVAAVGAAFADDITIDPVTHVSTKSRAEVQAELAAFKKAGVNPWSTSYNPMRATASTKSRAEVRAEVLAARAAGELDAMVGEDSGSAHRAAAPRAGVQLAGFAK